MKIIILDIDGVLNCEYCKIKIDGIIFEIEREIWILDLIETWYWDVDGKREDLLQDAWKWSTRI